jgi:hypothetical protein
VTGRCDGLPACGCDGVLEVEHDQVGSGGRGIREALRAIPGSEEPGSFRDAPLMIVGEGTNEIQKNAFASQAVARDRTATSNDRSS